MPDICVRPTQCARYNDDISSSSDTQCKTELGKITHLLKYFFVNGIF